ncbi:methionyl-tRNA formyltransferase [Alicyclobacillus cellulosilyticus]|uniref:Methionyl-tRNA formyltransferase n=1 Tax=Alicyclobacillus cellulosilyticus TaxID=1003997 RepID=A0A917NKU4_9BACL|nr:methionyl-tRNA formyltransferase [Alicyclobacillus cellulosilyticus]GGJ08198.1 methionyl-tRNA formyltransferase [Alicyclobacillus cellulosilyticus]
MTSGKPKLVFMGTPEFAVPSLVSLTNAGFPVLAVVTQPDRPAGRGQKPAPSPVKQAAARLGLPVLQPSSARDPGFLAAVAALAPDVIVTAAYGQILPQRLLDLPRAGCLNLHASLLPRWRGAAPVQRAILAGDAVTGVTVMKMVRRLDAGPVVGQRRVPIADDDDAGRLLQRLASAGAALLVELIEPYVAGEIVPTPQAEEEATYAERITKADEIIDWRRPVIDIWRQVRALSPSPGASARLFGQVVKVWAARPASVSPGCVPPADAEPAVVCRVGRHEVWVRCADGWLALETVQPAGKRRMSADDWARGWQRDRLRFEQEDGR